MGVAARERTSALIIPPTGTVSARWEGARAERQQLFEVEALVSVFVEGGYDVRQFISFISLAAAAATAATAAARVALLHLRDSVSGQTPNLFFGVAPTPAVPEDVLMSLDIAEL